MLVTIPLTCCNQFAYNNKIVPLIDIGPPSIQLCSVNTLLDKIDILNNEITQTNLLLFCIWFINVLMLIDWSSKK
jgi:hypothetical protein